MKSVTFSRTVTGGEGETLKEGGTYSLNDASADRWIKRGAAAAAETKKKATEEKPEPAQKAAQVEEAKRAETVQPEPAHKVVQPEVRHKGK